MESAKLSAPQFYTYAGPPNVPSGRPWLHFAHANGYPPEAYQQFIGHLTPLADCFALLSRLLQPNTDPTTVTDWFDLAQDLLAALQPIAQQHGPLIGVGHSIGGMLTLMSAATDPTLFRAIVMIDPVLFPPWLSLLNGWVKALRLTDRINPTVPATLRRRRHFASREAMFAAYRTKPVFARLNDEALQTAIDAMVTEHPDGQGVMLRTTPEWEAQIYRTMPHDGWHYARQLRLPLLLVRGNESDTFFPAAANKLQRMLPGTVLHNVPNTGHLLPLEQPTVVGELVADFVRQHLG